MARELIIPRKRAAVPIESKTRPTPVAKSKATEDNIKAFDGTPMPVESLPTVDMTNIEKRMLESMKLMSPEDDVPCMGLIYGDVGTGKTTKAMEIMQGIIPIGKKIVYVDSAAGWTTLMNFPWMMRDEKGELNVLQMPYFNIETLQALAQAIKEGKGEYANIGGIIFDEYTSMHDLDLNWVVQTRATQAEKRGEFKDRFTPALPDYNAARIRSNETIQAFMATGIHQIFIGHSKITKKMETMPDMPEKAGKSLYTKLHFAYLAKFNDRGVAVLQTQGAKRELAKNRINGIGSFTNPEEFIAMYKAWGGPKVIEAKVVPIPAEDVPEDDLETILD